MDMFDLSVLLFGGDRASPDATTVTATGAAASSDGEVGITLDADVTPAEDEGTDEDADQTIIDLPTSPDVDEGDELIVTLVGDGPLKTPVVTANPGSGDRMRALTDSAKAIADAAQAVADAINQHFWVDDSGAHVTQATQDEWQQDHSGPNSVWNSLGMLFRDGLTNLLAVLRDGVAIYDGSGNGSGNIVARLLGSGIQVGRDSEIHVSVTGNATTVWKGARKLITIKDSFDAGFVGATFADPYLGERAGSGMIVQADASDSTMIFEVNTATLNSSIHVDNDGNLARMTINNVGSIKYTDPLNTDGDYLQLGNPTRYQASGSYAITTAGIDTPRNGPSVTVPPGVYLFVGAWTFGTGSSSGTRNMQVAFRSGSGGSLWGEKVRIVGGGANFAVLNVCALRTITERTTVYLAGSASMTGAAGTAWITAQRLN